MNSSLRMPTNNHHRPGPKVRVAPLPRPGQHVRNTSFPHGGLPPDSERPRRADAPVAQNRHHVLSAGALGDALPLALLGMRTAFKADLQASAAELVYGEPLSIPGEQLAASPSTGDPSELITQLRHHCEQLRPVPATRHTSPAVFVHKDLADSTHVFLRQDAVRRPLDPTYSGPYKVLARTQKTVRIVVNGRQVTVSTDRV
jgi:hypothetical protein